MNTYANLPSFIVPVILEKLDFEEFANAFKVWMHGKSPEIRAQVLQNVDLCKYFKNAAWKEEFEAFMTYSCNLDVHDALFYLPAWHLVRKTLYKEDAFFVLNALGEEGHLRSIFCFNFFKILYAESHCEEAIQNMINVLQKIDNAIIKKWMKELHVLKAGWEPIVHNGSIIKNLCGDIRRTDNRHFQASSWYTNVDHIDQIQCIRCKVALLMFDFCNNSW